LAGIYANCLQQDWLYDEGDDTTKGIYQNKIDELKSIAAPIAQRYFDREEEKRQAQLSKKAGGDQERRAAEAAAKLRQEAQDAEMKDL
jgi:heat shock 70kDa protein 4